MKKKFLLSLMLMCISIIAFGMLNISAYKGTKYGDYLYYQVKSNGEVTITDCDESATEIVIPEEIDGKKVTSIGDAAFYNCVELSNIEIPNSVTSIKGWAFTGCKKLSTITIPDGISSIESHVFAYCTNLTDIIIPNGITSIGDYAFDGTSLTNVTIPSNVISIGEYAFTYCTDLANITIPSSVTSIGTDAFYNCTNLMNVYINDLKAYLNIDFGYRSSQPTSYAKNLYLNDELLTNVIIPNGAKKISQYAFYNNTNITSVTIPNSVTSIDSYAFQNCTGLTEITIPNSVTSIGNDSFYSCTGLTEITIPNSVTSIGSSAFSGCTDLTSITIPNSVTKIGRGAFDDCNNLSIVYYNCTEEQWNTISIDLVNSYLINANRIYFAYLTFADENGRELSIIKQTLNSCVDISGFEEKTEQVLHFYTDKECTNEFDLKTPITENTTLYLKYVTNKYTYKFVDEDGTVLKEETVDYGTKIVPPENPSKQNTKKYTYTFDKWLDYTEGMTVTSDVSFTAQYNEKINKYTYKFLDNDNTILKEVTLDYGTVITPPETPADKDPYTFDYWDGYTTGAELTDNVEFKAVYKYKNYTITAGGLDNSIPAMYNSNYTIKPQTKDGYNFIGYFTETNGKGTQITNEKGESLKAYDVVGDLTIYPYFKATHYNQVELQGATAAMPGDTIKEKAIFATDKEAMYVTATVKYPEYLNFKSISGGDFAEASKDSETVKDGYKYLNITCIYDYNGGNMPINKNLVPFEITFDVATNAPIENANISIENVTLIGNSEYSITDITNHVLEIKPKLAENVSITGNGNIDKITKYSAVVSPDYTTDKTVTWSVDNEEIATISQDGTLTPVKNGTVTIKATAKDGSGEFGTKTVNVTSYAKIDSLKYNGISIDIEADKYEYTIYVKNDSENVSITPTFVGGTLKANGGGIWLSGKTKKFDLNENETVIALNRDNVTDMTDNVYNIKVIKIEGTKTTVSEDGKTFTVKLINIDNDNTVILALYNDNGFVGMQSATYNGDDIQFTTDKAYTTAKVMVWNSLSGMAPIYEAKIVK